MTEAFDRAVKAALEMDWAELGVEEGKDGELHFPDSIQKRGKGGKLKDIPIMLRLPTNTQRVTARRRARVWLQELELDEEKDSAFFDELEEYEILAFCIREPKAPFDQLVKDGKALFALHPDRSMKKIRTRLTLLIEACDPRFGELNADEIWKVALRMAARGDASPLADIAGFEQSACIVFLAREALKSPTAPSWARSGSTSKPAPPTS